jgi:hypothetical protein
MTGTWTYTSADTLMTLSLRMGKDTLSGYGQTFYTDVLHGDYVLKVGGVEIINTHLHDSFVNMGGGNDLLQFNTNYDSNDNLQWLFGYLYHPDRLYVLWNIEIFKEQQLVLGQGMVDVLRWEFIHSELYNYDERNHDPDQTYFLPRTMIFKR